MLRASSAVAAVITFVIHGASAQQPSAAPDPLPPGVHEAVVSHDFAGAARLVAAFGEAHPDNLSSQSQLPLLLLLSHDVQGWAKARHDLVARWATGKGTISPPAMASFLIDVFPAGESKVLVRQCYEEAGKFNVSYRFDVVGHNQTLESFYTVESSPTDNQIAKESGQPTPIFTVDHFIPGRHETVAILTGPQNYAAFREKVIAYAQNPVPLSATNYGRPVLAREDCALSK